MLQKYILLKGKSLFRRAKFKNRACGAAVSCIPKIKRSRSALVKFGARIIIRAPEEQHLLSLTQSQAPSLACKINVFGRKVRRRREKFETQELKRSFLVSKTCKI